MESNMQQLLAELEVLERVVSHAEAATMDAAHEACQMSRDACEASRDTRQRAAALRHPRHKPSA
jgi:hypothetical protein